MATVLESPAARLENSKTHGRVFGVCVNRGEPSLVNPTEETDEGSLYFLSNLDQNIPHNSITNMAVMVQTVYCFRAETGRENEGVARLIKEALAKVLVHYYPLAGRLTLTSEGKLIVNCTGEGVAFVEAVADCDLEEIGDITKSNQTTLGKLVYSIPGAKNILEIPLLTVQVTKFKCGGFVLGLVMNHCMFDGIGAMEFINSWGEIARGLPLSVPPFLDRTLLKVRDPLKIEYAHHEFEEIEDLSDTAAFFQEQMLYKSFHFSLVKLHQLKREAMEDGTLDACTSFEAISSFIWKSRVQALRMHTHQETKLIFPVNGRAIVRPPLPKGYFGNATVLAHAVCTAGELSKKPLSFVVMLLQKAIKMVTDDYMRSAIDYIEATMLSPTMNATLLVANWAKLPLHTIDFGWGKPLQYGPVALPEKEVVFLLPHNERNGINVLLGLPAGAMTTFQQLMNT